MTKLETQREQEGFKQESLNDLSSKEFSDLAKESGPRLKEVQRLLTVIKKFNENNLKAPKNDKEVKEMREANIAIARDLGILEVSLKQIENDLSKNDLGSYNQLSDMIKDNIKEQFKKFDINDLPDTLFLTPKLPKQFVQESEKYASFQDVIDKGGAENIGSIMNKIKGETDIEKKGNLFNSMKDVFKKELPFIDGGPQKNGRLATLTDEEKDNPTLIEQKANIMNALVKVFLTDKNRDSIVKKTTSLDKNMSEILHNLNKNFLEKESKEYTKNLKKYQELQSENDALKKPYDEKMQEMLKLTPIPNLKNYSLLTTIKPLDYATRLQNLVNQQNIQDQKKMENDLRVENIKKSYESDIKTFEETNINPTIKNVEKTINELEQKISQINILLNDKSNNREKISQLNNLTLEKDKLIGDLSEVKKKIEDFVNKELSKNISPESTYQELNEKGNIFKDMVLGTLLSSPNIKPENDNSISKKIDEKISAISEFDKKIVETNRNILSAKGRVKGNDQLDAFINELSGEKTLLKSFENAQGKLKIQLGGAKTPEDKISIYQKFLTENYSTKNIDILNRNIQKLDQLILFDADSQFSIKDVGTLMGDKDGVKDKIQKILERYRAQKSLLEKEIPQKRDELKAIPHHEDAMKKSLTAIKGDKNIYLNSETRGDETSKIMKKIPKDLESLFEKGSKDQGKKINILGKENEKLSQTQRLLYKNWLNIYDPENKENLLNRWSKQNQEKMINLKKEIDSMKTSLLSKESLKKITEKANPEIIDGFQRYVEEMAKKNQNVMFGSKDPLYNQIMAMRKSGNVFADTVITQVDEDGKINFLRNDNSAFMNYINKTKNMNSAENAERDKKNFEKDMNDFRGNKLPKLDKIMGNIVYTSSTQNSFEDAKKYISTLTVEIEKLQNTAKALNDPSNPQKDFAEQSLNDLKATKTELLNKIPEIEKLKTEYEAKMAEKREKKNIDDYKNNIESTISEMQNTSTTEIEKKLQEADIWSISKDIRKILNQRNLISETLTNLKQLNDKPGLVKENNKETLTNTIKIVEKKLSETKVLDKANSLIGQYDSLKSDRERKFKNFDINNQPNADQLKNEAVSFLNKYPSQKSEYENRAELSKTEFSIFDSSENLKTAMSDPKKVKEVGWKILESEIKKTWKEGESKLQIQQRNDSLQKQKDNFMRYVDENIFKNNDLAKNDQQKSLGKNYPFEAMQNYLSQQLSTINLSKYRYQGGAFNETPLTTKPNAVNEKTLNTAVKNINTENSKAMNDILNQVWKTEKKGFMMKEWQRQTTEKQNKEKQNK